MIISSKSMEALSKAAVESFSSRMLVHLKKCFPEQCAAGEEDKIRDLIDLALARAARYGIYSERNVCKYTDLMYTLGAGFDEDPALPWAMEILTRDAYWDENTRMEQLIDATLTYLKERDARRGR